MNYQCVLKLGGRYARPSQVRWKQFKISKEYSAPQSKKKDACKIALEYFDFVYANVYGRSWPSIRLALLSDPKYCAIINTLTPCTDAIDILTQRGAVDMLQIVKNMPPDNRGNTMQVPKISPHDVDDMQQDYKRSNVKNDESMLSHVTPDSHSMTENAMAVRELRGHADDAQDLRLTTRTHDIATIDEPISRSLPALDALKVMVHPRGDITFFPKSPRSKEGVISWYLMDAASILPVVALGIEYGDSVLDLCAAPGGKALVALLTNRAGMVVCNDSNTERVNRMRRMLLQYVPNDPNLRNKVIIKKKCAIAQWEEFDSYDRVLVDVPCTSDRLSLQQSQGNVFMPSPQMKKLRDSLPELQTKLLIQGLKAVRPGGTVVYSTCSLSPTQNEGVVKEAVASVQQNQGMQVRVCNLRPLEHAFGSAGFMRFQKRAQPGSLVLPFVGGNHGPFYLCKLERAK